MGSITHSTPMLSLDKAYSLGEIMEWAKKYARSPEETFLIEPKYDGISAKFENGILSTRGDGFQGENISDKIPLIELEAPDYVGKLNRNARGEILVRKDRFKTIQNSIRPNGITYKNSRNILTGFMVLKEQKYISQLEFAMRSLNSFLTLVDYELFSIEVNLEEIEAQWDSIISDFEKLPYPLDGIVIKIADLEYRNSLGNTAHHPRGEIAFKFQNIAKESTLVNVEWSFGKNCLTPVAEIEPIDIGGITIKHATLHNYQNVLDRDIQIGDTCLVERAGDVIPYIKESTPGLLRQSVLIEYCPCCGSKLVRKGPEICCVNPDCFESNLQRLYASVKSIGIEELGLPNIRNMMTILNVKNLKDIFALNKGDLEKLPNFKSKKINNLFNELQRARNIKDYQLLAALNIAHIGQNMAKLLLSEHSLDELLTMKEEDFCNIRGIGPERAKALSEELSSQAEYINEFRNALFIESTQGGLEKPKICFTGKMPEKRSYYETIAIANNYEVADDVNSSLNLLVANNLNEKSTKINKAEKLQIKIISLDDWLQEVTIPESLTIKQDAEQLELF
jgi:DNA ligase (NAD+)